jgi:hypothetical protein
MNKIIVFVFAFVCLAQAASGQKITFIKTFGGMGFEMDTLTLSLREVQEMMRINPLAHEEFRKARTNYSVAGVVGFTGVLLVAVPLVSAVAGGQPEWGLAVAGGALIIVSIPLNRAFQRHAINALDEYNKQFTVRRVNTNLYFTGTGAKLLIRF